MSFVVFKLGGSLLDLVDLPQRLEVLQAEHREALPVYVVGGGVAADVVRGWDRRFAMSPDVSHRLAVHSMSLTARLVHGLLPKSRLVHSLERLRQVGQVLIASMTLPPAPCILDVAHDVLQAEAQHLLPASWDVTSDAIATWIALRLGAEELVFLKSTDRPPGVPDWNELARKGLIDPHTPQLLASAEGLAVRWVNLRTHVMR
ncbi:MAG: hypothetical protein KDA58_03080 [Planctomycetaceae bacterium]|nr:hypothetical protein [Planctomycetaceae bacterium]